MSPRPCDSTGFDASANQSGNHAKKTSMRGGVMAALRFFKSGCALPLRVTNKCFETEAHLTNPSVMSQRISRRTFSLSAGAALAALALPSARLSLAAEPFKRAGQPRLRLSLAAYSFREFFKDASHNRPKVPPADKQIDLFQFIDYCADHNCHGAELTSYYFPKEISPEFLLKIKRHAFLRGIELSGTSVGNTFTVPAGPKRDQEIAHTKKWIDHAALMGIPHIRVFAGNLEGQSPEVAKKNCIAALEECCAYAGSRGVFLGIENHGGIVAEPDALLDIIKSVQSPWIGINLDTANFHTDDPYRDLALCAPYAVNVQLKTEVQAKGKKKEAADIKRIVQILRDANYQGYLVLEYEAAKDPFEAVPRVLKELSEIV
jgi:sugar phosphate isomerase/epimerase